MVRGLFGSEGVSRGSLRAVLGPHLLLPVHLVYSAHCTFQGQSHISSFIATGAVIPGTIALLCAKSLPHNTTQHNTTQHNTTRCHQYASHESHARQDLVWTSVLPGRPFA